MNINVRQNSFTNKIIAAVTNNFAQDEACLALSLFRNRNSTFVWTQLCRL